MLANMRLAWLWLVIGAVLLPFAHIQTVWPIAAWLYPVFLMRFARTNRPVMGLVLVLVVQCMGVAIGMRNDYTLLPVGPLLAAAAVAYGALFTVPFVVDRLMATRLSGAPRTLVYPLTAVAIDYLLLFTPFHTFGSPAYTQYGDLPLMQMVSLTGIWGLTFLVSWLAPVVNEILEHGHRLPIARYSLLPFAALLIGVLVYGSARLTFTSNEPVVRVAGITPDRTLWSYPVIADVARDSDAERAALRPRMIQIVNDLLSRGRQEAQSGAKIITWSETAAIILKDDETAVLDRARAVARNENVYLQLGLMVILHTDQFPFGENRAILMDPSGTVVWDYHKAFPLPVGDGLEVAPGPAIVPTTQTPFGLLSGVICYDIDYVPYLRQAGLAGVGLLLAPADDWPAIENDHAHEAVYRAIENGFSVLRPTGKGVSLATDPLGRELAHSEYYTADRIATVAVVPVQTLPTMYSRVGDAFAWLSVAVLVLIIGSAVVRRPASDRSRRVIEAVHA